MRRRTLLAAIAVVSEPRAFRGASHWIWGTFLKSIRELGYIEGKNLAVEFRSAEDDYALLPELAAQLVAANVDVIVVAGGQSVAAAQKATRSIPIVIATAGDPVGSGFV